MLGVRPLAKAASGAGQDLVTFRSRSGRRYGSVAARLPSVTRRRQRLNIWRKGVESRRSRVQCRPIICPDDVVALLSQLVKRDLKLVPSRLLGTQRPMNRPVSTTVLMSPDRAWVAAVGHRCSPHFGSSAMPVTPAELRVRIAARAQLVGQGYPDAVLQQHRTRGDGASAHRRGLNYERGARHEEAHRCNDLHRSPPVSYGDGGSCCSAPWQSRLARGDGDRGALCGRERLGLAMSLLDVGCDESNSRSATAVRSHQRLTRYPAAEGQLRRAVCLDSSSGARAMARRAPVPFCECCP